MESIYPVEYVTYAVWILDRLDDNRSPSYTRLFTGSGCEPESITRQYHITLLTIMEGGIFALFCGSYSAGPLQRRTDKRSY
ncbi:hypothetical protein AB1N83_013225 [Pleurotus pulmonarius]